MPKRYSKELEERVISLYKERKTTVEIAEQTGIKYNTSVRRILLRYDVPLISSAQRNRIVKTNPFTDLSDPSTQYWLGYLASDGNVGCVTGSNHVSRVRLNTNKDPEHLKLYIEFLRYPLKVRQVYNKNYEVFEYSVDFSNRETAEYLEFLGITRRKSLTFKANFNFDWNFVRGYFDGNGSVSRTIVNIATGSKAFAEQLASFYSSYNISCNIYKHKTKRCYTVSISTKDSNYKWSTLIYGKDFSERLCLERKKNKVVQRIYSSLSQ